MTRYNSLVCILYIHINLCMSIMIWNSINILFRIIGTHFCVDYWATFFQCHTHLSAPWWLVLGQGFCICFYFASYIMATINQEQAVKRYWTSEGVWVAIKYLICFLFFWASLRALPLELSLISVSCLSQDGRF